MERNFNFNIISITSVKQWCLYGKGLSLPEILDMTRRVDWVKDGLYLA